MLTPGISNIISIPRVYDYISKVEDDFDLPSAKIKKMPVKQRPEARKQLKEMLKKRLDKVKQELPDIAAAKACDSSSGVHWITGGGAMGAGAAVELDDDEPTADHRNRSREIKMARGAHAVAARDGARAKGAHE